LHEYAGKSTILIEKKEDINTNELSVRAFNALLFDSCLRSVTWPSLTTALELIPQSAGAPPKWNSRLISPRDTARLQPANLRVIDKYENRGDSHAG